MSKVLIIKKDTFNPTIDLYEEFNEEVWLVSDEFDSSLLPQLWRDNRKTNESQKFYEFMQAMNFQLLEWEEITL